MCEDPAKVIPIKSFILKATHRSGTEISADNSKLIKEFGTNMIVVCRDGFVLPDASTIRHYQCRAETTTGIWLMSEKGKFEECVGMRSCLLLIIIHRLIHAFNML